ncbi:sugar transferase [Microbacterium marmarense]|uniref:Sugar transferase n=1 Tax=Microbacterium marmarense TaxID=3122051 RepID=A0ABU8LPS8_9MICO
MEPRTVSADFDVVPRQPRSPGWYQRLAAGVLIGDVLAIMASLALASTVRFGVIPTWREPIDAYFAIAAAAIGLVWLIALWAVRSRAKRLFGEGLTEYARVINGTLVAFGSVAVVCYVAQIDFARGYVAVALPVGIVLLLVGRLAWRRVLILLRRSGRCATGVMVVGAPDDVARTVVELRRNLAAGYRPVAVSLSSPLHKASPSDQAILDSLPRVSYESAVSTARISRIRAVMIAGELPGGRDQIRKLGWAMENSRAELILVSRLTDVAGPRIHLRPVAGLPMVHVQLPQYSGFAHSVKRLFDVVATLGGLLLITPVLAIIAILIRAGDDGPVLFRQQRIGVGGKTFTMLKFRSMVVDAEAQRELLESKRLGNDVLFKVKDDPRVTAVGRVLRRYSLDELPQLWNVLRGEMSLVGPRPPLPSEVEEYEGHETRRLISKPGITGLWQVSGRSDLSWDESIRLDLYYVENWSLTGDLLIIGRTLVQMFKHDGAY